MESSSDSGPQGSIPQGSIVVDEIVVPVTDVRLARGGFKIIAKVRGPVPAVDTQDYVLYDQAGRVVTHGSCQTRLAWGPVLPGATLSIVLLMVTSRATSSPGMASRPDIDAFDLLDLPRELFD